MGELERGREELIVLRCRLGEPEAFRELVDVMECRLFYYVRKFVEDDDSALDVLQEVWAAVFKQIKRLDEPERFRPWIYRIAHNKAISRFRQDQAEPSYAAVEIEEAVAQMVEPDWDALDAKRVHEAIGELSQPHREALVLYFVEGMSYEEIAEATGASLGLVKSRMHYAKKSLRAKLEGATGGAP